MAIAVPGQQTAQAPVPHRWWALGVFGLAQLMVVLDATIVNIALPSAQQSLHFDNDGRQWVVTAYSLAFGSLLLFGGRLADLFGRKNTLLIGLVGFAGSSALAGAAQNFSTLVAGRAAQGAFGALLAPSALSLLTTTFTEPRERARAFGVFGALAGGGGAIGLLLGGVLTEHLNWRWTLFVNLIFAALGVLGTLAFVRRPPKPPRPTLDVLGTLLAAAGLFCLVYGFANADTYSWHDPMCWGFLSGAALLLILFVLWERRAAHPLLPLRILEDRNRAASYLSVFVTGMGMFGVSLFLTYYLQQTLHYSPVRAGVAYLPMVAALMVCAQIGINLLVPRIGGKPVMPVGAALAAGGLYLLSRIGLHSSYTGDVMPGLILIGAGMGTMMPPAMSLATLGVAHRDQGVASAMVNTMQQVGGSIGTALFNTIAATAVTDYLRNHQPVTPLVGANAAVHSYTVAFRWAGAFFLVVLVVAGLLYRKGSPMAQMRAAHAAASAGHDADFVVEPAEQPGAEAAEALGPAEADTAALPAVEPAGGTAATTAAVPALPPPDSGSPGSPGSPGPSGSGRPGVTGRVVDASGAPVADAVLTLVDPTGRQLARAHSHADGSYRIDPPASADGACVLVGAAHGRRPSAALLRLPAFGGVLGHDVVLTGQGGLTGTVTSAEGTPLPDALVVATDPHGEVIGSSTTGPDGGYRFSALSPGAYVVTVSAPGTRPVAHSVSVDGTAGPAEHHIRLAPAAEVSGTVRNRSGRPLADTRVSLLDATGNVLDVRTTAHDGSYAFPNLSSQDYTLVATGYPPRATPIRLDGQASALLDLELTHDD
ncbi:MFS transporter [Phaeacidiphilus oryzae]|uniref:MFS transporter n=1 Tax=Phaeacidiphilus oryzae TaxID=348818 RepID=UPI00055A7CDE|nr:MFS transporter [Phaeacidiphilus oryzae]